MANKKEMKQEAISRMQQLKIDSMIGNENESK